MPSRTLDVDKLAYTGLFNDGRRARAGLDNHLAIGWEASYQVVGHVRFALDWTEVVKVTKATLRLTATTDHAGWVFTPGARVHVVLLTGDWTDAGGTGEGSWAVGGWGYPPYDNTFQVEGVAVGPAGTSFDVDLTKLMNAWAPKTVKQSTGTAGLGKANYGFDIAVPGGGYSVNQRLKVQVASDKHGTANWRPQLILDYQAAGGPGTVILTAPPAVISQVELEYFEGDYLQGRPGDYPTRHELELYAKQGDGSWLLIESTKISGAATASEQVTGHFSVPLPASLKSGIDYEWRARIKTSVGDWTPWTSRAPLKITTNNPNLTGPFPTGTMATLTGVFFGASYSDPDSNPIGSYRIQVRSRTTPTDPDWDAVPMFWDTSDRGQRGAAGSGVIPGGVPGVVVDRLGAKIKVLYEGQGLPPGDYSFRIRATDSLGADSAWLYADFSLTVGYTPDPGDTDFLTGYARRKVHARVLIKDMTTNRGPGKTLAIIEDAAHVGASEFYNNAGEFFFTLPAVHPQVSVIEPFQAHYALEQYRGDGWHEVQAGLITDFDATDDEVVFYGVDYLGLLSLTYDERYSNPDDPDPELTTDKGGSKYSAKTVRQIVVDQLTLAKGATADNSPVGFIGLGQIDAMDEKLSIFATFKQRLPFITGLLESHKAGTGKRTRLVVRKSIAGAYSWEVRDNPGHDRDNLRFEYGGLVQGFRVVPMGSFGTRLYGIGRVTNEVRPYYSKTNAPGVDEVLYGRMPRVNLWPDLNDKNDLNRRVKQMARSIGKVGKRMALGIRVDSLAIKDGWDITDSILVAINRGVVDTSRYGSGYWTIWGWAWHLYPDGHDELTLSLLPREDEVPADPDLIDEDPIHTTPPWAVPWEPACDVRIVQSTRATVTNPTGNTTTRVDGAAWVTQPTAGNILIAVWTMHDDNDGIGSMPGWTLIVKDILSIGTAGQAGSVSMFYKIAAPGESMAKVQLLGNPGVGSNNLSWDQMYLLEVAGLGAFDRFVTKVNNVDNKNPGTPISPLAGKTAFLLTATCYSTSNAGKGTPKPNVVELYEEGNLVGGGNPQRWLGYQIVKSTTGGAYDVNMTLPTSGYSVYSSSISAAFYCTDAIVPPQPGQLVKDEFVAYGDGHTTSFTTRFPYHPGSLRVNVDGQAVINGLTEVNPALGTFSLDFAPLAAVGDSRAEGVHATYEYPA